MPSFIFVLCCLSLLPADDTTGIKSIYTVYQGHELMFHVSTMLPYSKENKQQVGICVVMHFDPVVKPLLKLHWRDDSVAIMSHRRISQRFDIFNICYRHSHPQRINPVNLSDPLTLLHHHDAVIWSFSEIKFDSDINVSLKKTQKFLLILSFGWWFRTS